MFKSDFESSILMLRLSEKITRVSVLWFSLTKLAETVDNKVWLAIIVFAIINYTVI